MELQTLLGELNAGGLALGLVGCTADAIEVRGPVASLTPEVRAALAWHKPTLLALLRATPDPYLAEEREAIRAEADARPESCGFPFGVGALWVARPLPWVVHHPGLMPKGVPIGAGTLWAPPFPVASARDLRRARRWLCGQVDLIRRALAELPGRPLGCGCDGSACWGRVLVELIEYFQPERD